ncbi:hypothetical protein BDM02DRAFT_3186249 [Thelephora ganbajun]|uniref:Uncharacterized protein n=1 Tax=Thelephora ganbajun TaxID=370292 RepID=A0ACB6ZIT5_THEGA|nr:hypothetical protein BDM02DRAFT_3186249 [Thelephora ganbajun]
MPYHVLVLGATGFTGKLTVRNLNAHPERARFGLAIAGRSQKKLEQVKLELGLGSDVGSFVVDVHDYASVEAIATQARVIINAIGPYWKTADLVVRACALHGVHYLDLSGEPHFVRNIIQRYDYQAYKSNAVIIPSCGFDSVPADVSVYLANKTAKSVLGLSAGIDDSTSAYRFDAGLSGGTVMSIISWFEDPPRSILYESLKDFSFREFKGLLSDPQKVIYKIPLDGRTWYGGRFPTCVENRLVVQHTWSLFKRSQDRHPEKVYGDGFKYNEILPVPDPFRALLITLVYYTTVAALLFPPTRWLLKHVLPQPGTGPTSNKGFFNLTNISHSGSSTIRTVLKADGEPGYFGAARMISEASLSLALDFDKLPYKQVGGGGVLTPMSALGDVYIERMKKYAGLEIESEVVDDKLEESRKRR